MFKTTDSTGEFIVDRARLWWANVAVSIFGMVAGAALLGQEEAEEPKKDPKNLARLEFMRDTVRQLEIKATEPDDKRDLTVKMQPLLRYSDPARQVADSAVWRVGLKGRPVAILTSEVYGPRDGGYHANNEFVAIDEPHLTIRSGPFTWTPPAKKLEFQEFKGEERPADKPQLRLTQLRRLAKRFSTREEFFGNKVEMRPLPTPIDRYEPSEKPNADGAIFAFVWGVNPELLLFIESDGEKWSYAWARTSAANLWVKLDDVEVWKEPQMNFRRLDTPTAHYAIADSVVKVPANLYDASEEVKKP